MKTELTFYDCMPAMADVFNGHRPRPEPLPTSGILEHIKGYIADDRIAEFGKRTVVLAEKDEDLQYLVEKSEEIREWFPGSPIIYVAGKIVGFNEDATSIAVLQLSDNSKERVEMLRTEARRILDESGADITKQVTILPLAKILMETTGCGIDAAKRRIAEAIRRKRGEYAKETTGNWGGKRAGAGRPAYQFWRHITSGDIFAISINGGKPTMQCGPLHHAEVRDEDDNLLDPSEFNFDEPFKDNPDNYALVE